MKQRTREEAAALKQEILKFRESNPDKKAKEVAQHFGIKLTYYYYLTKTKNGKTKNRAPKQESGREGKAINNTSADAFSRISSQLREIADELDQAVADQKDRIKNLFLA